MMVDITDFRPVTLEVRPFFQKQYAKYPQVHSDNTFTNMVCWNHFAHYEYAHIRKNIVVSSTIEGMRKFRPPIGPRDDDILRSVLEFALREGDDIPLVLIDSETRKWLAIEFPLLVVHPDRDHFEYVYRSSDLADLPGRQYLTIRHQINRFRRRCSPSVELLSVQTREEVKQFLVEWCEWKHCEEEPFLAHEKEAIIFALDHLPELGLSGIAIRVNDKIGAISLFEQMTPDTALVHFEKGLPDCEGIYKAINAETAGILRNTFAFINRESDMGIDGLREAKTRYHPHHMVEVYYATSDDIAAAL